MPKKIELEFDAKEIIKDYNVLVRIKNFKRVAFRFRLLAITLAIAQRVSPVEMFIVQTTEVTCDAGYNCGDVDPYGFVPECGCPIHDPDDPDGQVDIDDPSGSEFSDFVQRAQENPENHPYCKHCGEYHDPNEWQRHI